MLDSDDAKYGLYKLRFAIRTTESEDPQKTPEPSQKVFIIIISSAQHANKIVKLNFRSKI